MTHEIACTLQDDAASPLLEATAATPLSEVQNLLGAAAQEGGGKAGEQPMKPLEQAAQPDPALSPPQAPFSFQSEAPSPHSAALSPMSMEFTEPINQASGSMRRFAPA